MNGFSEWMKGFYGYSWEEHEEKLIKEGFSRIDIVEELIGLTYVWVKLGGV